MICSRVRPTSAERKRSNTAIRSGNEFGQACSRNPKRSETPYNLAGPDFRKGQNESIGKDGELDSKGGIIKTKGSGKKVYCKEKGCVARAGNGRKMVE
jgi:hypothetical protein